MKTEISFVLHRGWLFDVRLQGRRKVDPICGMGGMNDDSTGFHVLSFVNKNFILLIKTMSVYKILFLLKTIAYISL